MIVELWKLNCAVVNEQFKAFVGYSSFCFALLQLLLCPQTSCIRAPTLPAPTVDFRPRPPRFAVLYKIRLKSHVYNV